MRSGAAMDVGAGPGWLAEACPPWCTREHHEDDHPEDRRHQSAGWIVSVDLPTTDIPATSMSAVDLAAYLDQPVGEAVCWLRLESIDSSVVRFTVRSERATDLLSALAELVAATDRT